METLNDHEVQVWIKAQNARAVLNKIPGRTKILERRLRELDKSAAAEVASELTPPENKPHDSPYVGATDPKDPVLSPLYADLHGFPPTLFITSTRDALLSGTAILHRAFLRAGVDTQLVVFEALPHAFWNNAHLPETKEADQLMAAFFDKHLGE